MSSESSPATEQGSGMNRINTVCLVFVMLLICAMVFLGIRSEREIQRRSQCGYNVKQLCFGIINYHDTFMYTPYGARCRTTGPNNEVSWGPAWMFSVFPFCESKPHYDRMDAADRADPSHDFMHAAVWKPADKAKIKFMLCPSSPLPEMEMRRPTGGPLMNLVTPSYVGISGAWGDIPNPTGGEPLFLDNRGFTVHPNGGIMSGGGMLTPNEALTFASVIDGTAYQIVVSETSDYYGRSPRARIDGAGEKGAWFVGCNKPAKARAIPAGGPMPQAETGPIYNLMTIRYGMVRGVAPGDPASGVGNTGIHPEKGANNPLNSAHPNGAMVGYLDGHVELLTYQVSELILKRLATRDDGGKVVGQ